LSVFDWTRRATEPEILDGDVPPEEAERSLGDLRFVNRWLGGQRSLLRAAGPYLEDGGRLLDVGCGSADLPSLLVRSAPRPLLAVGVDIKPVHLRRASPEVKGVVADVRALPFLPRSFDVVTASLFLHHFDGEDVSEVLRALFVLARRALVVNDLHRARVPFFFGRAVFPFLFRSAVSVSDGLLSIRRAFTPVELRAAFQRAGLPAVTVRRSFPYRLLAVAERPEAGAPR